MKVAIVHDDLVQWGGAERVLLGLSEIYPDASIYTSVFDYDNKILKKQFSQKKIITSFLQTIPGWKSMYKILLPFYPIAFEQFDFSQFDLVISHTTRFAKSIITKPQTKHICYCHTPPRFLWHFSGRNNYGLGELLLSNLRIYDVISAKRVDYFLAGSKNAQGRIRKVYGEESQIVYPFVDLSRFSSVERFDGGYFVALGRPSKYKMFDLIENTCKKMGAELKVIKGGLEDGRVVQVLAGCKALIIAGIEDFGLTSLEAQALGKPVVAFKAGGVLETVIPGKTGIFFEEQTENSLTQALLKLNEILINPQDGKENAANFSKENFIKNFQQTVASLLYTK
ncbi:MAG: glycosyltransferase [Actinobacteria bacterium]|nr:glycosyltransferase [Actinomycetota bacterium]